MVAKGRKYAKPRPMGPPVLWTDEAIDKECEALIEWMKKDDSFFMISFFRERGYSKSTFWDLCQKSPRLRDLSDLAKQLQEEKVLKNGMFKNVDPGMARWYLACHYDYAPKDDERLKAAMAELLHLAIRK